MAAAVALAVDFTGGGHGATVPRLPAGTSARQSSTARSHMENRILVHLDIRGCDQRLRL